MPEKVRERCSCETCPLDTMARLAAWLEEDDRQQEAE